jgi:phage shock protein C
MKKFRLDKRRGLFLGVCAGIADSLGIEVTLVRLGAVVLTLLGAFPWTFIAYGLAAWLAKPADADWSSHGAMPRPNGPGPAGADLREVDQRIAGLERSAARNNSNLAHEIDALR